MMPIPKRSARHAKKKAATRKPIEPDLLEVLTFIARETTRISGALERIVDSMLQPPMQHRVGPSDLAGGSEEYMSGQWHRRPGDVYDKVASPGTANAGDETFGTAHADDKTGPV